MTRSRFLLSIVAAVTLCGALSSAATAGVFSDPGLAPYQRTWERTDKPVADGVEQRTWMWGPESFTGQGLLEPYAESPGGERHVVYFDKSRMETTNPAGDEDSIWYVTNGLLVVELITGQMQVGDSSFTPRQPAEVNVAGDANDPNGPTYATFASVLDAPPTTLDSFATKRINRAGVVTDDPSLADEFVTIDFIDPVTNHGIAHRFWVFMNATGPIYENGEFVFGRLFPDPFFATGRPVTEPYWANVLVGGTSKLVLIQCFERRCMTYTPSNAVGWQIEAGNVGRHYYDWRYSEPTTDSVPPSGELLYESPLSDWETGVVDDGEYFVENGTYHLRTNPDGFLMNWLETGNDPFTDIRVSIDLRLVSQQTSDGALACLMTRLDPIDLSHDYAFCLTADGYTGAVYEQFNPEYYEELLPIDIRPGASNPNEWVRLSIISRGYAFWFLINDELVGTASHVGPPGGYVGFYVFGSQSGSTEFEFTNLAVWEMN